MSIDPRAFPRQLSHWSLHVCLNALPSFGIALFLLQLHRAPIAIAAMLAGIVSVILLLAFLTSLRGPLSDPSSLPARALKIGVRIRTAICLGSLLPALMTKNIAWLPDLYFGMAACSATEQAGRILGGRPTLNPGSTGFLPVFTTVLLEGVIIAFMVAMISFFALLFIQRREHFKMIRAACYR